MQHGQVWFEHGQRYGLLSHDRGHEQKQHTQHEIEKLAGVHKQACFRISFLTEAASMDIRKIRTAFFQHLTFYSFFYFQHSFVLLFVALAAPAVITIVITIVIPAIIATIITAVFLQTNYQAATAILRINHQH
ncbi:hypothetical protein ACO0LG_06365 [Undibacterium sp. Ji42W]